MTTRWFSGPGATQSKSRRPAGHSRRIAAHPGLSNAALDHRARRKSRTYAALTLTLLSAMSVSFLVGNLFLAQGLLKHLGDVPAPLELHNQCGDDGGDFPAFPEP
jgi:hypothetical protein